jgi:hypothetical protein
MNKQTKRIRRNRKNITRKHYGGSTNVNHKTNVDERSKGIFEYIGDKISGYSGKAFDYVKEKSLRLAGLKEIKKEDEELEKEKQVVENTTKEVDEKIGEISDAASGVISDATKIGSDVVDVFDKGSAAIIGNINDVLQSPKVEESISEAAEETAEIGEKLLEDFNEKLATPELKEETKKALENAADYTEIAVEAMDEPINKAVDELNAAGTKAATGVAKGLVKVAVDSALAVPGVATVVEPIIMLDDISRAAADVVQATSDATSTASRVVEETSKNIEEGLDKLEEKKEELSDSMKPDINIKPDATFKQLNKDGLKVADRVDKSISQFENPVSSVPVIQKGGKKTRRKLFKHKGKSKRVRFAI